MRITPWLWLLFSPVLHATGWTEQEVHAQQQQKEAQAASFFTPDIQQQHLNAFLNAEQYKEQAKTEGQQAIKKVTPKDNPDAAPPSIIVFASLGMPETSLKQLLLQAEQLHVPIVIRGIFGNDFNTTIAKVKKLVQPQQGQSPLGGVSINPIWFKQFDIKHVPAFVVMKPNTCTDKPPCDPNNYDVVYGNVSLFDALDTVAREGVYHAIARKALP